VPLDEFRENLASIIKHPLIVKGQTKVVLVTPPPLAMRFQNKTYGNGRSKRIRAAKRTQRYIAAVRDFADANNLALCDSEALLLQEAKVHAGGLPALYEDGGYPPVKVCRAKLNTTGLHLNEFGYHPISKALEDIIAS
jgi:lysophospholipase L1-like esterase